MVSLQSVMVAKHFNCVHITPDNLVVESDSKAAKKVQVGTSSKPKVLYKHWSKEKMVWPRPEEMNQSGRVINEKFHVCVSLVCLNEF